VAVYLTADNIGHRKSGALSRCPPRSKKTELLRLYECGITLQEGGVRIA
jgi:hypothetical protein